MRYKTILGIAFCMFGATSSVGAQTNGVEDLPVDARGGRFREIATGLVWLDVSNFNGSDFTAVQNQVAGSGFRLARKEDVQRLIDAVGGPSEAFGSIGTGSGGRQAFQEGFYDDSLSGTDPSLVGVATAIQDSLSTPPRSFVASDDETAPTATRIDRGAWVVQQTAATCESGPKALDFDCDGQDDRVVWRESSGTWFVNFSGSDEVLIQQWGLPGDVPIAGDYDGDGIPDLAVWRPTTGVWFIKTSMSQYAHATAITLQFGLPGDKPLRVDFDGDGRLDVAVWRPTEGNFYYVRSTDAQIVVEQWGLNGDVPLESGRQ